MDLHEEAYTSSQIAKRIRRDQSEIHPNCGETKPIFLSHSGKEKAFVRRLYNALVNANHDPFLDTHSLPPGEHFPPYLIQCLEACKLGVVVLSPHFLTSKWPMRELHILHTSPSSPKILPLFYKLHPNDLKHSSPQFAEWQAAWQDIAEKDPSLASFSQLESAVVQLPKIQGVVHNCDTHIMGEDDYIEEVLRHVSRIIRPLLRYDISNLTGHERLTKEVDGIFQTKPVIAHQKAHVIGFYGIAGLGKTTVCKLMVNDYASIYAGRCALIEFPTNDRNEKEVVSQCRKALNQLASTSKATIDRSDDFDQCLELMKRHVSSLDVFIALDNIWEACLDLAQRILDVGFSSNSKILVTSRSSQVLINLLQDRSHVKPLPSVNSEEARQMFVKCFNRNQLRDPVQLLDDQVDDVIRSCRFNGVHHALGISALGVSLGRIAKANQPWFAAWKQCSHAQSAATDIDDVVDKATKINFDSIPPERRNIFLDVALIYIPHVQGCELNGFNEILKQRSLLHEWLSALYQEMKAWKIMKILNELALGGLLEFEESGAVHVHDLYRDLAIREASASGNFLLVNPTSTDHTSSDEDDDYIGCGVTKISASKEPGRIVLQLRFLQSGTQMRGSCSMQIFEGIHLLSSCYDLYERGVQMCALEAMPSLRVLKLRSWFVNVLSLRHKHKYVSWLDLSHGEVHKRFLCDDIAKLSKLSFLSLKHLWIERGDDEHQDDDDSQRIMYRSILCLDGLVNLRVMVVEGITELQEISGLGSLMNLECMILRDLPMLRKVGDFSSCCSRLQDVRFHGCKCLTQVEGVDVLLNLQITNCQLDLSQYMSCLQELNVYGIMKVRPYSVKLQGPRFQLIELVPLELIEFPSMDVQVESGQLLMDVKVEIQGLCNLKTLCIMDDGKMGRLRFDGLVSLRELVVKNMVNLEEISGLGSLMNLECMTLSELPSLSMKCRCCTRRFDDCRCSREVEGLDVLPNLTTLRCEIHAALHLLSQAHMPNLKTLSIMEGIVEEIVLIGQLPSLETLYIGNVRHLKRINFSRFIDLGSLREICIEGCRDLEEVVNWSYLYDLPNLTKVSIISCGRVKAAQEDVRFTAESHLAFVELVALAFVEGKATWKEKWEYLEYLLWKGKLRGKLVESS